MVISGMREALKAVGGGQKVRLGDLIALSVETTLERISPAALFVPTRSGTIARSSARFRSAVWITALSLPEPTCRHLQFSYGVFPVQETDPPEDWRTYAMNWMRARKVGGDLVVFTEGPSAKHPEAHHRMEIFDLGNR